MNITRWHKERKENPRSTSTPCLTSKTFEGNWQASTTQKDSPLSCLFPLVLLSQQHSPFLSQPVHGERKAFLAVTKGPFGSGRPGGITDVFSLSETPAFSTESPSLQASGSTPSNTARHNIRNISRCFTGSRRSLKSTQTPVGSSTQLTPAHRTTSDTRTLRFRATVKKFEKSSRNSHRWPCTSCLIPNPKRASFRAQCSVGLSWGPSWRLGEGRRGEGRGERGTENPCISSPVDLQCPVSDKIW